MTLPNGTCTCPDGQRGSWCKHALRALFQTGKLPDVEGGETPETESARDALEARVERFEAQHPDAAAIDVLGKLGIDPTHRARVEEVLGE